MAPRVIKLNVGGVIFHTAASTLRSCAFFDQLLSETFVDLDTASGEAFVDRDGRYFHLVLNFLRSGAVELPLPPLTLDGAIAEAEYFNIDSLVEALRGMAMPALQTSDDFSQMMRADGSAFYVCQDPSHPESMEVILFERTPPSPADFGGTGPPVAGPVAGEAPAEAPMEGDEGAAADFGGGAASTCDSAGFHERGTLLYSCGPCAAENLLALRAMPRPLPRIWRESAETSTVIALFTQRFIARGLYEREGRTLLCTRGEPRFGSENVPSGGERPATSVSSAGVFLPSGDLLLLGPDHTADARSTMPLLEQLGLAPGAGGGTERFGLGDRGQRMTAGADLGGGFKRFTVVPTEDLLAPGKSGTGH
jgi:hypothetical protein